MQHKGISHGPKPWSHCHDFALSFELQKLCTCVKQAEEISQWCVLCWDLQSNELLLVLLTLCSGLVHAHHLFTGAAGGDQGQYKLSGL